MFRDVIQQELVAFKDAWFSAEVHLTADITYIERVFHDTIRRYIDGTEEIIKHEMGTPGLGAICISNLADLVLLPCAHACLCHSCYNTLRNNSWNGRPKCPMCRLAVRTTEPFTAEQRAAMLLPGGEAHHSELGLIRLGADAKRSFCVMGDVHIPGLS